MLKALRMMLEAKDDEYNKEKTADKTKKGKDEPEMIFNFRIFLRYNLTQSLDSILC